MKLDDPYLVHIHRLGSRDFHSVLKVHEILIATFLLFCHQVVPVEIIRKISRKGVARITLLRRW